MAPASLVLGVSVGGAFALLIICMLLACCIYMHKHPNKRSGKTVKVQPDNIAEIKVRSESEHLTVNYDNQSYCFCCVQSASETVPPPDPPIKIELKDLRSNDVTICWKPPVADAASRIDSYVLFLRPSDKPNDWTLIAKVKNNTNQYLVQKLEADRRYVLGVASKNRGGVSPIMETKPFILKKETVTPGKPTSVVVTDVQKDRLTLLWQPPKSDGNSKIIHYHVLINDGGNNWTHYSKEDAFKCFVENLKKNIPYKFRICAENAIGFGPCAETKDAVFVKKDLGPPLKPLGPIRYNRITHNSVALSWKQRSLDTFPPTGYIIEMSDLRTKKWRKVGETAENVTTFCVPKLPEDTEFKFRVIAKNSAGKSAPLIGKTVKTTFRDTSASGSSRNSKSAYALSCNSSNTKLTKSALARVLAHWEVSTDQQVAPRATNSSKVVPTAENDNNK